MTKKRWLRSQASYNNYANNLVGYPPPSETHVLYPQPIRNSAIGHPAPIPRRKGETNEN